MCREQHEEDGRGKERAWDSQDEMISLREETARVVYGGLWKPFFIKPLVHAQKKQKNKKREVCRSVRVFFFTRKWWTAKVRSIDERRSNWLSSSVWQIVNSVEMTYYYAPTCITRVVNGVKWLSVKKNVRSYVIRKLCAYTDVVRWIDWCTYFCLWEIYYLKDNNNMRILQKNYLL